MKNLISAIFLLFSAALAAQGVPLKTLIPYSINPVEAQLEPTFKNDVAIDTANKMLMCGGGTVVELAHSASVFYHTETIVDTSTALDIAPNPYPNEGYFGNYKFPNRTDRLTIKHGKLNSGTIEMPIGTWFYIEQYPGVEWKLEQRLKQKK